MKSAALILGVLISAPFANSWYTIRMSDFNLVDFSQASTIVIQPEDGLNRQVGEGSNAVQVNQINLTPPSGKESIFFSQILAAGGAGGQIKVHGVLSGSVINATKVSVLFK